MKGFLLLHLFFWGTASVWGFDFLRTWTCVGIHDRIDWSKPVGVRIGELPLVLWKSPVTGKILPMVNVCKHMGSKLDIGTITDQGRIKCPYHGLEFDTEDAFGQVQVHEGKVFWSHRPLLPKPYRTPFFSNPNYAHSFLEIDMDASLTDCAFNSMDVHHPEYVHRMGFGSTIPPSNLKQYRYTNREGEMDRVGLAFDYESNTVMQSINQNAKVTHNFHMFLYPSFTWSRVSFNNKHLMVALNLCPLSRDKTRWYVTLCHNYKKSVFGKELMKTLALTILSQDHVQMKLQQAEGALKNSVTFRKSLDEEEVIWWLRDMMMKYQYPDEEKCAAAIRDGFTNEFK